MIITMRSDSDHDKQQVVVRHLQERGYQTHLLAGGGDVVIGVNGRPIVQDLAATVAALPGVSAINRSGKPYMLAQREARPAGTVVRVGDIDIGRGELVIMAGPCVIEGSDAMLAAAQVVKEAGATMLRGGAFKPRTSPYSFQGLGEEGLKILALARDLTGLPVVTEVMEPEQVDLVARYADMLQIGSRNMSNFPLLRRVAATGKPILLKRGFSATIEEWLMSAEYILAGGNDRVVLCERGIRSFDTATRFTLDLNAVPLVRQLTHLPIVVDPSHGTGRRELVEPMAAAGIASGAHGLIVEVHPDPDAALCDAQQSIAPDALERIVGHAHAIHRLLNPIPERVALLTVT
ncbi:MAG TPA: 3-deoxy-7-phosphoheptulonate synthase [Thermomicrobiales bacterium]|nr:3-deoxy-7-phosphoheptulonate synthase [Thermomicrobiales bacterium]